jgi:phosphoglycerate kinase
MAAAPMALSGLRGIKTIRDFNLRERKVFLRLDLNVPMENGVVTDVTRIEATLPTIKHALENGAKLMIASHLGRPKSKDDKKYSMEPVGAKLSELTGLEVILVDEFSEDAIKVALSSLKRNQVVLLENVRFEEGETKNSTEFAQIFAACTDVYINDAFGASHRAHATIEALPQMIPEKGIGFLIEKEIEMLDRLMQNPAKPYLAILGGAKISDKIAVIEKFIDIVDGFVIGGAMAYTFLKARGIAVGQSLVESDKLNYAREMIKRMEARNKTLLLPVDHVIATGIKDVASAQTTNGEAIPEGFMGVDIGPRTIQNFSSALREAKTIFWNGPMGVFEVEAFSKGTFAIAKILAENTGFRVVGGGDSAAAAEQSGYADKMSHISTGGGASLEYLQGDRLPGLEVLRVKKSEPV